MTSTPLGHCRAQRAALDYHCTASPRRPSAQSHSLPWQHLDPNEDSRVEDEWQGCCSNPSEEVELAVICEQKNQSEGNEKSMSSTPPRSSHSLWAWRAGSPCPRCGSGGAHV